MRPIVRLSQSVERLLTSSSGAHICRSCQLRLAASQQRQIHSTKNLRAPWSIPKLPQWGWGKSTTTPAETEEYEAQAEVNDTTPGKLDPSEDPNYAEALSWEGLEWIGSDKWVDKELDDGETFRGWGAEYPGFPKEKISRILQHTAAKAMGVGNPNKKPIGAMKNAWLSMPLSTPLSDPEIKFQIVKKMRKATGIRLSDFTVRNATTLGLLRDAYIKKPKEKKLAEHLSLAEEIQGLANVKISSRRITPIDKEKQVGRWKLIERELLDRGLPVTGHTTNVKRTVA